MDTRAKIKKADDVNRLLAEGRWTVLCGHFDPLTSEIAEQLEALKPAGDQLLAIVKTDSDELLDTGARAILLAGLRCVNVVTILKQGESPLSNHEHDRVKTIDFKDADQRGRREFEELVLSRERHAAEA